MGIKTKLLIVDDELINLAIYKGLLEDSDIYTYEIALNGEEALKIVPIFRPDIILLDVMMPGIDGYEVSRQIRNNNQYKFIKILIISAKASIEERLEGYDAGADDYITKPFDHAELMAKLQVFRKLKRTEEIENIQHTMLTLLSHEIRTPLNGIMGAAEIFQIDDAITSDYKDMLEILVNSSNQIVNLVDRVFLFCKLKFNINLTMDKIFLASDINSTIHSVGSKRKAKNVSVVNTCDDKIYIYADWKLFSNVIEILIDNAIKFSHDNNVVTISSHFENNYIVIKVSDNGKGIENTQIDNIFNAFANKNTLNHHEGLGINLAISKLIMEHHNGFLSVESEYGKGSTFICKFPYDPLK